MIYCVFWAQDITAVTVAVASELTVVLPWYTSYCVYYMKVMNFDLFSCKSSNAPVYA